MRNGDPQREGSLYFISSETQGAVKIGFAEDTYARLKTLQTGNPDDLTLVGRIPCLAEAELLVHRNMLHKRLRLEWYRWDAEIETLLYELQDDMFDAGMELVGGDLCGEEEVISAAINDAYFKRPLPTALILRRVRECCPRLTLPTP